MDGYQNTVWLTCALSFKGRQLKQWKPNRYACCSSSMRPSRWPPGTDQARSAGAVRTTEVKSPRERPRHQYL
jgi:hypothetical protein